MDVQTLPPSPCAITSQTLLMADIADTGALRLTGSGNDQGTEVIEMMPDNCLLAYIYAHMHTYIHTNMSMYFHSSIYQGETEINITF